MRYCKDKANLSRCFRQTYPNGSKKIVSTCRKLWSLLVCKKVHFFFEILHTHYFEYWAYIALATKNDSNSLKIILMYIFMQNIFESFDHETRPPKTIATTCRKLDLYLHAKNWLNPTLLSWDIITLPPPEKVLLYLL